MKHKILKRTIAAVLSLMMLVSAIPLTAITAFAADTDTKQTVVDSVKVDLSGEDIIKQELAARTPVTKDRSEIKSTSQAAVYKDGELYDQGDFSPMWNVAMSLADDATGDKANDPTKSRTIEYVLNQDFWYDASWFGEETMTISNKVFTIDLNGCLLYRKDGAGRVIMIDNGSIVTIMDSNPTKEHNGRLEAHNIWKPSLLGTGQYPLYGGVICGGYLKTSDGGGVMVNNGSSLTMTGGTIAGNKADCGSGLFIGEKCSADMSRGVSQICYNYSAGTSNDGGAVFLRTDASVVGGYVHHNYADDWGGGVRAKGGNILVKDMIIYANTSEEEGGGLFIERRWIGQTVTVTGCKIIGNMAGEQGGGVYIWDNYSVNMSDCIIVDNVTNQSGGGICLSNYVNTPLHISGKMIVRDNFEVGTGRKIKSNLYLEGNNKLVVETMSLGSEVHIRTKKHADEYNGPSKSLLSKQTGSSHLFFFADEEGYCVKYQDDPDVTNYRRMYLEKGTRVEDHTQILTDTSPELLSTGYTLMSGQYKDTTMPLYKGYFEYGLMSSSDFDSLSPFYYSDGYFFEDPTVYNTHLATMSINMAVAAFGRSTSDVGDNAYANHFANVKQLFYDIGCADVNFFANEDYQMKPAYYGEDGRLSTIAVAISQKEIKLNDETYTLVPIAIRGGGYEAEWASNVTIGAEGEAAGFSDAATQVYTHVQNYINNYGLSDKVANGKVKFWVVGYSRAGATANLTSKRLVDNYAEVGNQIYGYTFEAPMGGVESAIVYESYTGNGTYPTIHNTVNELDFVTLVAPAEMGFFRYGVDHLVGSTGGKAGIVNKPGSDYYEQRMKMIAQLNAINPYYKFDDSWEVADVNLILGNIPVIGTDIIDKGEQGWDDPNDECENMYRFLRWFFERVQGDGLGLPTKEIIDPDNPNQDITINDILIPISDFSYAREYFSTHKPLASIEGNINTADNYGYSELTVQEAAVQLMYLIMQSLTDEQMSEMVDGLMANVLILKSKLGVSGLYNKKVEYIDTWCTHTELQKAEKINWLMSNLLSAEGGVDLATVLNEEQMDIVTEAIPVVLWFALNYASLDYQTSSLVDDGMWGIGTFINNASAIISNHYQEVSVAWVRSYDSFYTNDVQSYTIDPKQISYVEPVAHYASGTKQLSITAEGGASIFYSLDGGNSWILYTKEVAIEDAFEEIQYFSIYRGAKSEVKTVSMNPWSGTALGNGNIWFLILGCAFIVGFCVVGIEISRKKKKTNED